MSGNNRNGENSGIKNIANGVLISGTNNIQTTNNSLVYNAADLMIANAAFSNSVGFAGVDGTTEAYTLDSSFGNTKAAAPPPPADTALDSSLWVAYNQDVTRDSVEYKSEAEKKNMSSIFLGISNSFNDAGKEGTKLRLKATFEPYDGMGEEGIKGDQGVGGINTGAEFTAPLIDPALHVGNRSSEHQLKDGEAISM